MTSDAQEIAGSLGDEIKPYRVHVSSKYIELTKRKLELTRLPHDVADPRSEEWWDPRAQVEPLIDFWLEDYSWRQQEEIFNNDDIPQYRTSIPVPGAPDASSSLRMHFVHVSSKQEGAIPLLLIPPFPFTALSLTHLIDLFTSPQPTEGNLPQQPFHLVIPSLPGLGFSDALPSNAEAISTTAELFNTLMTRLSYPHYLVSNCGPASSSPGQIEWQLVNYLATKYSTSCLGAHLINPPLTAPKVQESPLEWVKWTIARWLQAPVLGYSNDDLFAVDRTSHTPDTSSSQLARSINKRKGGSGERGSSNSDTGRDTFGTLEPNTLAYGLCDSPVGLLVFVLKNLRALGGKKEFSQTELVTMTMLAWLPGPEAALRFWAHCVAHPERGETGMMAAKPKAAVTTFLGEDDAAATTRQNQDEESSTGAARKAGPVSMPRYACPGWAKARFSVVHVQRATGAPGLLAWERPELIVQGVSGLAKRILASDERLRTSSTIPDGTVPLQGVTVSADTAAPADKGVSGSTPGDAVGHSSAQQPATPAELDPVKKGTSPLPSPSLGVDSTAAAEAGKTLRPPGPTRDASSMSKTLSPGSEASGSSAQIKDASHDTLVTSDVEARSS